MGEGGVIEREEAIPEEERGPVIVAKRKEDLEEKGVEMVVQLHPDKGATRLYVQFKNVGSKTFYVGPSYFILKTKDGDTYYYSYDTYTTPSPFFGRRLEPGKEVRGFFIFETDGIPEKLVYEDKAGNKTHWAF